jgi:hypothetical protein
MRTFASRAAPLVLAVVATATAAAAAPDGRIDVTVSHTGRDAAGKRLAAVLAGTVAANPQMKLVTSSDLRLGLYLVTMPRGDSTIYAATWTIGGMADDGYLTSKVGVCANDSIRACARGLAAETARHANVLWSMNAHAAGAR